MAKQINPVSIPMQSKLSLAEVDDLIHSVEDASFAEKNSITYQGIIRNAHITKNDGYLTTNGNPLTKSQLFGSDGVTKIGTKLTDKNGKVYNVKHEWLLKDSYQLKNYTGGKVVSATVHNNFIFVLYDDEGLWSLVVADAETKELVNLYQLDQLENIEPCISAVIGSVYNSGKAPTLWMLTHQEKTYEGTDSNTDPDKWKHELYEIVLEKGTVPVKHVLDELSDPLGHDMTATDVTGYGEGKTVAFDDIDQERRAYFRLKNGILEYHPYFGTVSPSGLITGEPIPGIRRFIKEDPDEVILSDIPDVIERQRLNNGTIAWDVKKAVDALPSGQKASMGMILGYSSTDEILYSEWRTVSNKFESWVSANISVNDVAPKDVDYPENDPRTKPQEYFISNFADSRGVYYDWGQGWSKTYVRICDRARPNWANRGFHSVAYMYLCTIGATPVKSSLDTAGGKGLYRVESLIPKGGEVQSQSIPFVPEHLNERVYTVGGDNKGENSILGAIPFAVDLLYQGPDDPDASSKLNLLKTQIYGLVESSYSFKQTLITTPSEVKDDEANLVITWERDRSLTLFSNGEIYEIIKSSDVKDFKCSKVADYSFKLNVLDNKNLVKEDRDGNISLTRAFIPYNMDCFLDIATLKLQSPIANTIPDSLKPEDDGYDAAVKEKYDSMTKDPNDAWFEGVGLNVNLDVDNPAMSFLLPKIRLPLWISEQDWNTFKNEAVDRRNSILKPVLSGCLLEDESVDVYYTLQNDSQDCTYKSTQMMKLGKEAEAAGWNIHGKSTYDVLKKGMSWWMEEANTVIFPIGIGSTIAGINFITPSAQLPQGYASRLYTNNNRLFLGFNYLAQIWHGATIFTIYGSNYYYDGQGIYFVGADQDFTNNNFVTYALGMKFLANSGSEAYFYSDFEKRIYVFTGSNTLQPADLLSSIDGTIVDAVYSSKEQVLYMLTSGGRIIVRSQVDICQLPGMSPKGHLEGTTEGAAVIDGYNYKIFSPWSGEDTLPFALRTEHFGSTDFISKLAYADILLYKNEDENPLITITCQTLNGIEKKSEKVNIKIKPEDWRGNTYKIRFTPKLNIGNAFDIGIYSMDKIGVQSLCMYMEPITTGKGDAWQNNVVNSTPSVGLTPTPEGTTNVQPSISVF